MIRSHIGSTRLPHSAWLALTALLLVYTTARAADDNRVPAEFLTCAAVKKNAERLVCYDHAMEQLSAGESTAAKTPSAEAAFGMVAQAPKPGRSAEREELATVKGRIVAVKADRQKLSVVELDNGQTWRQISGSTQLFLKPGDEVTISRGALNSFLMSIPNGRPVRVRRVQ